MKTKPKSANITWQELEVRRDQRRRLFGHGTALVWFTGLSGSGKSTVAREVERLLFERSVHTYVLDGDNIRFGLNRDLGFSPSDRKENIRRVGEVAKLFVDAGLVVMAAFISPYREDREAVRGCQSRADDFIEVHIDAPLDVCEERDPKGLYKKARAGLISSFTGISAPYEAPEGPEISLSTGQQTPEESAMQVIEYLIERGILDE